MKKFILLLSLVVLMGACGQTPVNITLPSQGNTSAPEETENKEASDDSVSSPNILTWVYKYKYKSKTDKQE